MSIEAKGTIDEDQTSTVINQCISAEFSVTQLTSKITLVIVN